MTMILLWTSSIKPEPMNGLWLELDKGCNTETDGATNLCLYQENGWSMEK